jgi:hypothetical protein
MSTRRSCASKPRTVDGPTVAGRDRERRVALGPSSYCSAKSLQQQQCGCHRVDAIGGCRAAQVIEHVAKARLVVADLSFHDPNVFYELALRHATGSEPSISSARKTEFHPTSTSFGRFVPRN